MRICGGVQLGFDRGVARITEREVNDCELASSATCPWGRSTQPWWSGTGFAFSTGTCHPPQPRGRAVP